MRTACNARAFVKLRVFVSLSPRNLPAPTTSPRRANGVAASLCNRDCARPSPQPFWSDVALQPTPVCNVFETGLAVSLSRARPPPEHGLRPLRLFIARPPGMLAAPICTNTNPTTPSWLVTAAARIQTAADCAMSNSQATLRSHATRCRDLHPVEFGDRGPARSVRNRSIQLNDYVNVYGAATLGQDSRGRCSRTRIRYAALGPPLEGLRPRLRAHLPARPEQQVAKDNSCIVEIFIPKDKFPKLHTH